MMVSSIKIKENEEYKNLLDLFFPVGSIYLTISSISPSAYLGGTWIKITAGFLAIAESTPNQSYTTPFAKVGAYAGSMYLGVSQMPSHTHTGPSHTHTGPSHTHELAGTNAAAASNGSHSHNVYYKRTNITINNSGNTHVLCSSGNANASGPGLSGSIVSNGAHTHTLGGSTKASGTGATGAAGTGATGSTGGGQNFMPYHYAVYAWRRTA